MFGKIPCSWIRIRIPNKDPDTDPGEPSQCGCMRIRIRNTGCNARIVIGHDMIGTNLWKARFHYCWEKWTLTMTETR
jgi:hypothetical protein